MEFRHTPQTLTGRHTLTLKSTTLSANSPTASHTPQHPPPKKNTPPPPLVCPHPIKKVHFRLPCRWPGQATSMLKFHSWRRLGMKPEASNPNDTASRLDAPGRAEGL